ncbi:MAG: AAA-associated domain-containing protein [Desulfurococcaceae archaeon]
MPELLPEDAQSKKVLIPPDVTPDHVLGLAEVLFSLGGSTDPMYIGDAIGENIGILPHAIDLAEVLNIVKLESGSITLTDFGVEIARSNNKVIKKLLRGKIRRLEPLGEIIEVLRIKGSIPVEEYDKIIRRNYPSNDWKKAFRNILIWGAFLKIFRMSEDDKFILPIDLKDI